MSLKIPRIPNVNQRSYTDTSDSQSGNLLRELRQTQVDVKNSAIDIINVLQDRVVEDSPYVLDRKSIDVTRIHNSPYENNWKEVPSYEEVRNVDLNMKKLNII